MNIIMMKRPPSDLAARLRKMADDIDAGLLTDIVIASVTSGNYEFTYGASLLDCLVMSDLLHQSCIDRMRRE